MRQLVVYTVQPDGVIAGWWIAKGYNNRPGRPTRFAFTRRKEVAIRLARALCRKAATFQRSARLRILREDGELQREHFYDYPRGSDGRRPRRT